MILHGVNFRADGTLGPIEITGPSDFEVWLQCWKVFANAMIMLHAIDLGVLEDYEEKITSLNRMLGSTCWLQLYQADVRARLEHVARIKPNLVERNMSALAKNEPPTLDLGRPWKQVYEALLLDDRFWTKEFERPAFIS